MCRLCWWQSVACAYVIELIGMRAIANPISPVRLRVAPPFSKRLTCEMVCSANGLLARNCCGVPLHGNANFERFVPHTIPPLGLMRVMRGVRCEQPALRRPFVSRGQFDVGHSTHIWRRVVMAQRASDALSQQAEIGQNMGTKVAWRNGDKSRQSNTKGSGS